MQDLLTQENVVLANSKVTAKHNARNVMTKMKVSKITSCVKNMKCHNHCTHLNTPAGVGDILGLSLIFCLYSSCPNHDANKKMSRLRHPISLKLILTIRKPTLMTIPITFPSRTFHLCDFHPMPPRILKRLDAFKENLNLLKIKYLPKAVL